MLILRPASWLALLSRTFTFELSLTGSPQANVEYDYVGKQSIPTTGLSPASPTALWAAEIGLTPRSRTRGPRQATNPWPTQPAWSNRGRRTWRMITRVPRELGRPCLFHRARRLEIPPTNSRLIHGSASGAGGDEQRTQRWYRKAKETKRGEMGGRESQRLIVPVSQGNHPEGTLGREGGAIL